MMMLPSWRRARNIALREASTHKAPFVFYKEGDWYIVKMSGNACMDGTIARRPLTVAFPSGGLRSFAPGETHILEESKC